MSHTKINLMQVEDMAPRFGMAPQVQARYARKPLELERSGVSTFRIQSGFRLPFGHTHAEQEEVYVVLSGTLRVKVGDDVVELGEWDAIRVPPGEWRGMEAGEQDAVVLAIGAPNTNNEDAELQPDWWTD